MSLANVRPAILFVCLGNICRSPMAEGALRAAAARAELDIEVASAGTASYHIGEPPDLRAIATARAHGVDITGLRVRQIAAQDFHDFTHILALDSANLEGIRARAPRDGTAHVALVMDAVEGRGGQSVKDPYYGDEAGFADVWDEVALAADALIERLLRDGAAARF
jgi:protein-tyrosine phosphatase